MKKQIRKIQQLVQFHISRIQHGEGNGNLLQYSCLENSMSGGAWWAMVHGGRKESDTNLKRHMQTHFHCSIILLLLFSC